MKLASTLQSQQELSASLRHTSVGSRNLARENMIGQQKGGLPSISRLLGEKEIQSRGGGSTEELETVLPGSCCEEPKPHINEKQRNV